MKREEDIDLSQEREAATERAVAFLADKGVSSSDDETGYFELYDLETGEIRIFAGEDAGIGEEGEFHYLVPRNVERYAVLVWAHTHPAHGEGRQYTRINRQQRRPSRIDINNLSPYAPLVIKDPRGKIRVYPRRGCSRGAKNFRDYPVPE